MDLNLNVRITLSDQLFDLLEDKLPNLGRRVERRVESALTKEIGARVRRESNIEVQIQPAAPAGENAPAPEAPGQAAEPQPSAEAPVQQPEKELTEEDIRAAMHRTRQRFEGEDYKENTDSEAYKKYHKQLTGMFKQIAAVLGADKPSALPADRRASFIAECDALTIDDNGCIVPPPSTLLND